MKNESGLRPVGHAVLVMPYEPEIATSIIHLPPDVRGRATVAEARVVVVAIGSEAWIDERVPRAAVGDKVLVTKFAGAMTKGTLDNKDYRVVNDRDIFLVIEKEATK